MLCRDFSLLDGTIGVAGSLPSSLAQLASLTYAHSTCFSFVAVRFTCNVVGKSGGQIVCARGVCVYVCLRRLRIQYGNLYGGSLPATLSMLSALQYDTCCGV